VGLCRQEDASLFDGFLRHREQAPGTVHARQGISTRGCARVHRREDSSLFRLVPEAQRGSAGHILCETQHEHEHEGLCELGQGIRGLCCD